MTLEAIIGGGLSLIAIFIGLWFGGKSRGKSEQKAKSDTQQAQQSVAQEKARTESVKVANDVKDEVMRSNPGSVRDKLRDEWTRPGN